MSIPECVQISGSHLGEQGRTSTLIIPCLTITAVCPLMGQEAVTYAASATNAQWLLDTARNTACSVEPTRRENVNSISSFQIIMFVAPFQVKRGGKSITYFIKMLPGRIPCLLDPEYPGFVGALDNLAKVQFGLLPCCFKQRQACF